MLGIGEPVLHRGKGLVFDVIGCDAGLARFGGDLDGEDVCAEAFIVGILRVEGEPRGCFMLGRDCVQILFESGRRLDGRVVRLLGVGERREFTQKRSESQLGVKLAQRRRYRARRLSSYPGRVPRARPWEWWQVFY